MTNRETPANVEHAESAESAPTAPVLTDVEQLIGADADADAVTAIVREWAPERRQSAIIALVTLDAVAHAPTLAAITSAPFGADPAPIIADRIAELLDAVAAIVRGAVEHVPTFTLTDAELIESFGATLTRAEPLDAESLDALVNPAPIAVPGERRTRQSVGRDWTNDGAACTYSTPGRETAGVAPGTIRVTVDKNGVPTFTCSRDGEKFGSPTSALRHQDRYNDIPGNWGSPFEVCRATTGTRKGERMHVITLATPE